MIKCGALTLAVFYLLLTTGDFACLMNCSEQQMLTTSNKKKMMHDCGDEQDDHCDKDQHEKSSSKEKEKSCCSSHISFAVKESLNTSAFHAHIQIIYLPTAYHLFSTLPLCIKNGINWPKATGPPGASQLPLYISYNSLLI